MEKGGRDEELLTDAELCDRLRISPASLSRHQDKSLKKIRRVVVGGQRRWVKTSVDKFIHGNKEIK